MYRGEALAILKKVDFIINSLDDGKVDEAKQCASELYRFVNEREEL